MDRLMMGLSTTAIGILVVFFGLVILIGCIYVMTFFTRGRGKKPAPAPAPVPKAAPVPAPAPVEEDTAEAEDNDALIAVISAAIAAVWQNENTGFVVRRVRRVQSGSARARAARDEQIFSHL